LPLVRWISLCVLLLLISAPASAQTSAIPGDLTTYSTIYSIGVEWDIANDANHDARVDVEYKPATSSAWQAASPLLRIDYNGRNMLAGSVMFLSPDTEYQVRLTLFDPDGGGETREIRIRTRPVPVAPAGGRVFHVVPGSGGGDGSAASPFRGVDAAQAVAQPGDTFLMHAGYYGSERLTFASPGAPGSYIVWKAAGDGEVTTTGLDIVAGHLWFEGLTVRDQRYGTRTDRAPSDVVITRCAFVNNFYSIFLNGGGSDWYIADNTIYGATPYASQSDEGEGIELAGTSGHTVAHNSITNVADGLSTPRTNVDIFGNDIFNTADDGLELDTGLANVRAWQNRIHNAYHNGISFQPQNGGPWYIIRNQIVGSVESPFKFRTTDRFVLVNNTIVNFAGPMICCSPSHLLRGLVRNNLWVSAQGGQIWNLESFTDWRTDIDYDGFDWGNAAYPLVWNGLIYYDVPSFARASGLEQHGVQIFKDTCFAEFNVPGPTPTEIPPQLMTLRADCNALDAGAILPNLTEPFTGAAPDLGAYEYGVPAPQYGPRPATAAPTVAITAPEAGVQLSAPASITLQAAAFDSNGISEVDYFANGAYLGAAMSSPYVLTWSGLTPGTYSLTARATDATGLSTVSAPVVIAVAASTPTAPPTSPPPSPPTWLPPLPAPWSNQDIGSVTIGGYTSVDHGVWALIASGADVWDTTDAFQFAYRTLSGDGSITARVTTVSATNVWTKAGVMMREDLSPGSRHVFMLVTPSNVEGSAFQRRLNAGGESLHTPAGPGTVIEWVRLTRRGTVVTAQYSDDGVTWITAGSESIAMNTTIFVGLALTSHDETQIATATFDNVSVTSEPSEDAWASQDVGAVSPAGSTTATGSAFVVTASGADIWGTSDAFRMTYRVVSGNFDVTARVTSVEAVNQWTKAGVMVRASLSAGSAHASLFATPTVVKGIAFQRRETDESVSLHTAGPPLAPPVWVRLSRRGRVVTAWYRASSADPWIALDADTIALAETVFVGLAVTSHQEGVLATAVFDNVSIDPVP
jgi:regulation of enolase protein 1 (concanavalin A-like superfamily)